MRVLPEPDTLDEMIDYIFIIISNTSDKDSYYNLIISDIYGHSALPERDVAILIYDTLFRHKETRNEKFKNRGISS